MTCSPRLLSRRQAQTPACVQRPLGPEASGTRVKVLTMAFETQERILAGPLLRPARFPATPKLTVSQ